ncbi:unnamed protein product [Parajaminaea phylloscopi]
MVQGKESPSQTLGEGRVVGAGKDKKGEPDGDSAYFSYYAQLQHQAQMLQDAVRTSIYQLAILGHTARHFQDKLVMDVGAGNGILSLFALQAGARKVYAVEASQMVQHLQTLVKAAKGQLAEAVVDEQEEWYLQSQNFDVKANNSRRSNEWLADKLVPVSSKVEDVTAAALEGNPQVDTIVSECLGVLLVHERMCESFIDARDRFLKPGGAMFPSAGTICFAPIEDKAIWDEVATKARFWHNANFYGVDLQPFFASAWREAFASPVVGCFNPHTLLAGAVDHVVDFQTVSMEELKRFEIPLDWTIKSTALVHGIGGWFDLHFQPSEKVAASEGADSDATDDIDPSSAERQNLDATMSEAVGQEQAYGGLSVDAPTFRPASSLGAAAAADKAGAGGPTGPSSLLGDESDPSFLLSTAALQAVADTTTGAADSTYMSTSPFHTPTHWQQARLLFPEPLAVNRGQRLVGSMTFVVNDNRSYDISAEVRLVSATGSAASATTSSDRGDLSTTRHFKWNLDRQTYSFTTTQ